MVLFLCGIVIMIDLSIPRKYAQYIIGVMFGLITIFVMTKIMVVEGRFVDFRHITMTMTGFIGGPVSAVIAAIMSSLGIPGIICKYKATRKRPYHFKVSGGLSRVFIRHLVP